MKVKSLHDLIIHDGVQYSMGDELEVTENQAEQLLAVGAVEILEDETEGKTAKTAKTKRG